MIILGIETATRTGSIALVSEDEVLAEYLISGIKSHAEQLLRGIDQVLTDTGRSLAECAGIAVSIGPGSFTGLRIGVSTAKALAFAAGKPIVGVPTLEALAANLPFTSCSICPLLDARKKEVYTALYQWTEGELQVLVPERAVSPLDMINQLDRSRRTIFIGNGSRLYERLIREEFGKEAEFSPQSHNCPRASIVASLGLKRLTLQQSDRAETLVPTYLRPSDAEIHWSHKHNSRNLPT
ncbi:MAG: tRNA (adenosine(37)-N6)-threonylcarbamoyltransferase complex dimerization subunit type 1 TsaB [bacterium]